MNLLNESFNDSLIKTVAFSKKHNIVISDILLFFTYYIVGNYAHFDATSLLFIVLE